MKRNLNLALGLVNVTNAWTKLEPGRLAMYDAGQDPTNTDRLALRDNGLGLDRIRDALNVFLSSGAQMKLDTRASGLGDCNGLVVAAAVLLLRAMGRSRHGNRGREARPYARG